MGGIYGGGSAGQNRTMLAVSLFTITRGHNKNGHLLLRESHHNTYQSQHITQEEFISLLLFWLDLHTTALTAGQNKASRGHEGNPAQTGGRDDVGKGR